MVAHHGDLSQLPTLVQCVYVTPRYTNGNTQQVPSVFRDLPPGQTGQINETSLKGVSATSAALYNEVSRSLDHFIPLHKVSEISKVLYKLRRNCEDHFVQKTNAKTFFYIITLLSQR